MDMSLHGYVQFLRSIEHLMPVLILPIQVALRMYRNKTAVTKEVIGEFFNPKTSQNQGRPSFIKVHGISTVTPDMIAYAAIQVSWSPQPSPSLDPRTCVDLCGPVVHAIMGRHGWDVQSHPLLPPHHQDALSQ